MGGVSCIVGGVGGAKTGVGGVVVCCRVGACVLRGRVARVGSSGSGAMSMTGIGCGAGAGCGSSVVVVCFPKRSRSALVCGPTIPTAGRPFACWKAATACAVRVPK